MSQARNTARSGEPGVIPSFFEHNPQLPIFRRAFVEAVGTAFLVAAMIGSGIAASKHVPAESLAASLLVAVSIAGALVGLIVALGKVSGGHFNPLITLAQYLNGERGVACSVAYIVGQTIGGILGALVAATMFGYPLRTDLAAAPSMGNFLSEAVAAAGLMTIVLGCARSTKWDTGPFAVGAWLVAAIIATPSTSYANPAVTLAAIFAPGLAGLSPVTAAAFVVAQIVGMFIAMAINKIAFAADTPLSG
ncbi:MULTISPECIES: aquaporin [unclassified Rhizobium]|uniref:aquaporin n=1 Tax=unclassified Rhizobium TaxID=2613769 RepID=UPI001ADBC9AE|nr:MULTISPECIES: aquaporin [unclassified Rhizobium]MBO9127787.1 aquaporin [Rhizobium sp. 16-488-2b]MBO9178249.1 aquaporin [Rhizobium sp. 16-488-2a]